MPRPVKCRRVCRLPGTKAFGPIVKFPPEGAGDTVAMTVEELETVRLLDLEELDQEQCARIMGVARSTVQRIYGEARKKIAHSIVLGKTLIIGGGNYRICTEEESHACGCCGRHRHGRRESSDCY